tara:strand:+ start:1994 stop:2146 length:153 start_codon:yes stop_codon:yes gene_type:complete
MDMGLTNSAYCLAHCRVAAARAQVAPAAHGVLPEPPPLAAARSLVLVSKV